MSSEAITRNDLANILNGVLPSVKQFGNRQSITLPFTASTDGIVQVYAVTNQVSGGYAALYINCGASRNYGYCVSNMPALGGAVSGSFFAKAGETITNEYSANIGSVYFYFIPLVAIIADDDTGWLDISTGIGKYRRKNGHVTVDVNKSMSVTGSWVTIGSVPEGFRPATGLYFTGIPSSGVGISLYISASGDIQVKAVGSTGTYSVCGTITYPVD